MILSNEPGYYREGAFGIRIENLIVVTDAPSLEGGDDHRAMLNWRTLTFAPIDRRLIVAEMLDSESRAWLNAYHAETYERLAPRVSPETAIWLSDATRSI
jgi:Xaa-Pro aminopeptidase